MALCTRTIATAVTSMTLTTSDYNVLSLVHEYMNATDKRSITYDSLIAFAKKHAKTAYKTETIQRSLRRLAIYGFFERRYVPSYQTKKRIVIYVPTQRFYVFFNFFNKGARQ